MQIKRDAYLTQLIDKKHNGLIKIVSGVRRCGKTYLLFELFRAHLLGAGVPEDHIICLSLDDFENKRYREAEVCYRYVKSRIRDTQMYYVLLDEVQMLEDFESVLNGFLHVRNLDIYVTGSNSRFLSTDVVTEFRGRGDEVRVYPLSFSEFYATRDCYWEEAWKEYALYGGMPLVLSISDPRAKKKYLRDLFEETYLRDIIERNHLQKTEEFDALVNILASGIGGLLNPRKIAATFASVANMNISAPSIRQYLDYLEDAFLIQKAQRYDVRGRHYIDSPYKYYFTDIGLRNARINFRQKEEPHIMENIIYNELCVRGFRVDVGSVTVDERGVSGREQKRLEVDFVVNDYDDRIYIQSAHRLPTAAKRAQEERPLLSIRDAFRKVIITRDASSSYREENGVLILPLHEFLLHPDALRR